jgi:hypothetical protein
MSNPQTQATSGTRHLVKTNKTKNTPKKTKAMSKINPPGLSQFTKGKHSAVPISYRRTLYFALGHLYILTPCVFINPMFILWFTLEVHEIISLLDVTFHVPPLK